MGGWLDQLEIRLTSASVEVAVEVKLWLSLEFNLMVLVKGGEENYDKN